jgi:uncharacterized protein YqeY
MLEDRLNADIKAALLGGDQFTATTLRGLKATILNVKVAEGSRDQQMPDQQIQSIFAKEAKKRQESADLFKQGGNNAKADQELAEKKLIETYLPAQLSEQEIKMIIDDLAGQIGAATMADMGKLIGAVKGHAGPSADGALVAKLVKEKLSA